MREYGFQRWYAFAVFLLRAFFKARSDTLIEWKASTFVVMSETFFALAAVLALSLAAGWNAFLQSRRAFLFCGMVIFAVFYFAHASAEKRLLPRFEEEFRYLTRAQRLTATIGVLAMVVLSVCVIIWAATAVRNHLTGVG